MSDTPSETPPEESQDHKQAPGPDQAQEPKIELENGEDAGEAEPAARPPRVTFGDHVLAEILRHARSDISHEIAGVLLGEVYGDSVQRVVVVDACIRAAHTRAARGNVTFTHDTWEQINATIDEEYPDLEIVGWYHSHPDFGIFLSSYDTFIHENFFSAPWQIAYVIDPVRGDRGCFVWRDGGIERLDDHFVHMVAYEGGEEMEQEREEKFTAASDVETPQSPEASGGTRGWLLGFLALLVAFTLILQVYSLLLLRNVPAQIDEAAREIEREMTAGADIAQPPPVARPAPGDIAEDDEEIDFGLGSEHLEPPIEEPVVQIHRVVAGETLRQISRQFYDTPDNYRIIARLNGLPEDAQLKAGMKLIIPQVPIRDVDAEQTGDERPADLE